MCLSGIVCVFIENPHCHKPLMVLLPELLTNRPGLDTYSSLSFSNCRWISKVCSWHFKWNLPTITGCRPRGRSGVPLFLSRPRPLFLPTDYNRSLGPLFPPTDYNRSLGPLFLPTDCNRSLGPLFLPTDCNRSLSPLFLPIDYNRSLGLLW